jgi:hypothetical protein
VKLNVRHPVCEVISPGEDIPVKGLPGTIGADEFGPSYIVRKSHPFSILKEVKFKDKQLPELEHNVCVMFTLSA